MKIIIAGGSGMIGSALSRELSANGYEVVILTRSPEAHHGLPSQVRTVGWDAQTASGWGSEVDGAHAIVNLAGATLAPQPPFNLRWTAARKQKIYHSRIDPGKAILEAVLAAREVPQVLIQSSAIGFYGPRGDELITESHPPGNDYLAEICKAWEASTQEVETLGVRRAIIRSAVVLDKNEGSLPLQLLPFRLFVGGPIGRGTQGYSWIHIHDEVAAIKFLIENPDAKGPFNLSAPKPVTNAEFGRVAGTVLKRPSFVPVPGFAFKLLFGEAAVVLLEGQKVVPQRLLELGFKFRYPSLENALRDVLN